ncbi:CREB-regulated transcription coactivator 2 [Carassius auratus]|uniref:CREB-regulated transcription coactivator 2 n=1 Tax=Carassius auratus TaxID=7957 RepID=A0A6P6LVC3_CARAU|nr:CREB-regulated transcription coactivator 2-like [Carassius auratus]XP_052389751.1 CREB-regulated transcription coactivator 2 [Carassius gibelio]
MHLSGAGLAELGHGQGPGAGSAPGSCNPRKFSEKIALHNQRQAEDTAAFREVMMDVTSIRVQAERIRQTRDLVPYYGGSLPNVNQISSCSTETQHPSYLTQQLLEADEEYRDVQPSPLGRLHRRHFDSAPYLSTHLSPPRGPSWRRNWSNCSATEKSQMVFLPLTALNRTNSDSALHTSVRNTQLHGHPKSVQNLNQQSRHFGFAHPAPLIEENIQEETQSPKLKKLSSIASSGYETPVVYNFPLADQQASSLPVPSALSMSGSLPDLSSLHLPSPLPVGQDSEPHSGAEQLSNASTHPGTMADFNLPGLSSSLQASLSNPLLQSSLSNPNIQSCLSSHSLPSSLSSTSLRLSLSNSSLQSSLSNQSLQSSLSSSSLSNQSVQSSASRCSHSSGMGGSRSCSSSSLSGSPRVTGHTHAATSRKRAQLSPLIVPGGGESRWQHPKQFSPTVSPTMSSVSQGALLNKVLKETKPPAYPCTQHLRSAPPLSHQSMRQYFQPEAQHQSIPEMEQWSQDEHQSQHQQTHNQTQQHHVHKHSRPLQHHSQPHSKYHQQLLYHCQTHQPHISMQALTQQQQQPQQHQVYTQFQPHQIPEEQYQCPGQWQMPCQEGQYQNQQLHQPITFPSPGQEKNWQHATGPHGLQHAQMKRRHSMQTPEEPKPLSKVAIHESQGKGSKVPHYKEIEVTVANPGLQDKGFELNKESYVGLHLTPSQEKALSQQLGVLQKEPLGDSRVSDLNCEGAESKEQLLQNQSNSAGETQNVFNINVSDPSSWLDQDLSSLSDSVLEFDLETFNLDTNLGWP